MSLLTLTFLEIVLGIDNIIFIAIAAGRLKEEDQAKRWVEHFKELLNCPDPPNKAIITPTVEDINIDTSHIMTNLRKACPRNQPYIAGTNHHDTHTQPPEKITNR